MGLFSKLGRVFSPPPPKPQNKEPDPLDLDAWVKRAAAGDPTIEAELRAGLKDAERVASLSSRLGKAEKRAAQIDRHHVARAALHRALQAQGQLAPVVEALTTQRANAKRELSEELATLATTLDSLTDAPLCGPAVAKIVSALREKIATAPSHEVNAKLATLAKQVADIVRTAPLEVALFQRQQLEEAKYATAWIDTAIETLASSLEQAIKSCDRRSTIATPPLKENISALVAKIAQTQASAIRADTLSLRKRVCAAASLSYSTYWPKDAQRDKVRDQCSEQLVAATRHWTLARQELSRGETAAAAMSLKNCDSLAEQILTQLLSVTPSEFKKSESEEGAIRKQVQQTFATASSRDPSILADAVVHGFAFSRAFAMESHHVPNIARKLHFLRTLGEVKVNGLSLLSADERAATLALGGSACTVLLNDDSLTPNELRSIAASDPNPFGSTYVNHPSVTPELLKKWIAEDRFLLSIAASRHADTEILSLLLDKRNADVDSGVSYRRNDLTTNLLSRLAENASEAIRESVVREIRCRLMSAAELITACVDRKDPLHFDAINSLLRRTDVSEQALLSLLEHNEPPVRCLAARCASATPKVRERALRDSHAYVRATVAQNQGATSNELAELLRTNPDSAQAIAEHHAASAGLLAVLASNDNEWARNKVAIHGATSLSTLATLAYDPSHFVRATVAENPNSPIPLLRQLAGDPNDIVRATAFAYLIRRGQARVEDWEAPQL